MKKNLITAILMTIATTVLLGIIYPLVVTGLAQVLFHDKANGQTDFRRTGSHRFAHHRTAIHLGELLPLRPSAAGNGYDATTSDGSQLGSDEPETYRSRAG